MTEFRINTYIDNNQDKPNVTTLANGDFIVVWESTNQDGDSDGIYAQRYDNTALAVGTEFLVNTNTLDNQRNPAVTSLDDGGYVITWQSEHIEGSLANVYGQRYDNNSLPVGSEFQINTETFDDQWNPSITNLNDGGFLVVWQSWVQDGNNWGIYAQRFDNNGNSSGVEFQINDYTSGNQQKPVVKSLNNGNIVILWESYGQDGGNLGIYGKVFDSNANLINGELLVNTYTTDNQSLPSVSALENGNFVATWESLNQDGDSVGIYGKIFDANGNLVKDEFQINTYTTSTQSAPSVTGLHDGSFVAVWESLNQDGSSWGVYGQRFDDQGNTIDSEFRINTETNNAQSDPSVTALDNDSYVVTWQSSGQDGSLLGIFGDIISYTPVVVNQAPYFNWIYMSQPMSDGDPSDGITLPEALPPDYFIDPDGDPLDYTIEIDSLPYWADFDKVTKTLSGNPPLDEAGYVYVTFIASDGELSAIEQAWVQIDPKLGIAGIGIDNYIANATVFFDVDKDGILDPDELFTTTDQNGFYSLALPYTLDTNNNGQLDPDEGTIVLTGGFDTATGLPLETPLKATPDATVINLLTTLVAELVDQGLTVEEANTQVADALSLPNTINLNGLDPIAATQNNLPNGVESFAAMVKVQNFITQSAGLLSGVHNLSNNTIVDAVVKAISTEIQGTGTLNLTDSTQLETIINNASAIIDPLIDIAPLAYDTARITVAANQRIDDIVSQNLVPSAIEEKFAQVQKVALGDAVDDLQKAGAGTLSITSLWAQYTGTNLDDKIAAQIPNLIVNTILDQNDGNLNDGLSLREAILIANSDPAHEYVIVLDQPMYQLTIDGANEDQGLTGDLDFISGNDISLVGLGETPSLIYPDPGIFLDETIDISNNTNLTLNNVIFENSLNVEEGSTFTINGIDTIDLGIGSLDLNAGYFDDGMFMYEYGGLLNLNGVSSIIAGYVDLSAYGNNSVIDLSGVESFTIGDPNIYYDPAIDPWLNIQYISADEQGNIVIGSENAINNLELINQSLDISARNGAVIDLSGIDSFDTNNNTVNIVADGQGSIIYLSEAIANSENIIVEQLNGGIVIGYDPVVTTGHIVPIGNEYPINDDNSYIYQSDITELTSGNTLVVWSGENYDSVTYTYNYGLYGQLLDNNGIPIGNDFLIGDNSNNNYYYGDTSDVTELTNGNILVVWSGENYDSVTYTYNSGVYGQLLDSNGISIGNDFLIGDNSNNNYYYGNTPDVIELTNGNLLVVWNSQTYDPVTYTENFEVYGQLLDSNGNQIGDDFLINENLNNDYYYGYNSDVVELNNSNVLVVWSSENYDSITWDYNSGVYGQLLNSNGNQIGNDFLISDNINNNISVYYSDMTELTDGNLLIVWEDGFHINGQILDGSGNQIGNDFWINDNGSYSYNSSITELNDGKVLVVWNSEIYDPVNNYYGQAIYGQLLDSSGNQIGNDFLISDNSVYSYYDPIDPYYASSTISVTELSDGGFIVSWSGEDYDPITYNYDYGMYGQRFDNNGNQIGENFLVSGNDTYYYYNNISSLVELEPNKLLAVWNAYDDYTAMEGIFAQKLGINQENTPPTVQADKLIPLSANITPLGITAPTDVDGDPLTITISSIPDSTYGVLKLSDGTVIDMWDQNLSINDLTGLSFELDANVLNTIQDLYLSGISTDFSYTVSDGEETTTQSITLANSAPYFNWNYWNVEMSDDDPSDGITLSQALPSDYFIDPEGQPLTYEFEGLPDWIIFDGDTLTANPPEGTFWESVGLKAIDPFGLESDIRWFDLEFNDKVGLVRGRVIDGYIVGATVFYDINGNSELDEGELSTTTDENGFYSLAVPDELDTNGNGQLDPDEGTIVVFGGVDSATGLPLETPLKATPDSEVVTLLTTLVAELVEDGLTVEQANNQVTTALSLPDSVNLNTLDPIDATNNNQIGGVETFEAMVQVQNLITQTTGLIEGASGLSNAVIVEQVINAIADEIQSDPNPSLNLTETTQLESIINQAATNLTVDVSNIVTEATQVIVAANEKIEEAIANSSPSELAEEFAKVQKVALGETTQDLEQAGAGTKSITDVVIENTGDGLEHQIDNVQVLSEAPTDILLTNDSVAEKLSLGTEVGKLISVDPDSTNHTYSLVSGEGDTNNDLFEIVGDRLLTKESFDYEIQNNYSIRVLSSDGNGGVYSEPLTINIIDVPDNDNFDSRINLSSALEITEEGINTAFTGETGELNHGGVSGTINSAWWSWVAPSNDFITMDTFGSDFNTILAIYTGNSVDSLTRVVSNDNVSTSVLSSRVSFATTAGTEYQIAIDGYQGGTGNIQLNISNLPVVSIENLTIIEDQGTANFTVSVNGTTSEEISINYTTNNGTAEEGIDYTNTSGTLIIPAGTNSTAEITVPIIDNADAPTTGENFSVNLSNVSNNASISDNSAIGTIVKRSVLLEGTPGDDIMVPSSAPNDTIISYGGSDIFDFNTLVGSPDSIADFEYGVDKLDVSNLLANETLFNSTTEDAIADGYIQLQNFQDWSSWGIPITTGQLYIDTDGVGGVDAQKLLDIYFTSGGFTADNFLNSSDLIVS